MPDDFTITTELLFKSALVFALMDAVYISLLVWRVKPDTFGRLKWNLIVAAAVIWFGIWNWALGNVWETVYTYVFPAWARTWVPWIAFFVAGFVAWILWMLALRTAAKAVPVFCLLGGILGILTHLWAVYRGIVTKPPMLQGASPVGAVTFACFEFIFYWCVILTLAVFADWLQITVKRRSIRLKDFVGS